jgi:hypothetical protein
MHGTMLLGIITANLIIVIVISNLTRSPPHPQPDPPPPPPPPKGSARLPPNERAGRDAPPVLAQAHRRLRPSFHPQGRYVTTTPPLRGFLSRSLYDRKPRSTHLNDRLRLGRASCWWYRVIANSCDPHHATQDLLSTLRPVRHYYATITRVLD